MTVATMALRLSASLPFILALSVPGPGGAQETSPCRAAMSPPVLTAKPRIVGDESVTSRVRVLGQPESPVAILTVDLERSRFLIGGGWYTFDGSYTFEVINRSTVPVHDFRAFAYVRTQEGSAGGGPRWKGTLEPGATTRIHGKHDAGGTAPDDAAVILVGIMSADCAVDDYLPIELLEANRVPPPRHRERY